MLPDERVLRQRNITLVYKNRPLVFDPASPSSASCRPTLAVPVLAPPCCGGLATSGDEAGREPDDPVRRSLCRCVRARPRLQQGGHAVRRSSSSVPGLLFERRRCRAQAYGTRSV